jgi:acetyl esterase/lipase
MMKSCAVVFAVICAVRAASAQTEVLLWPKGAPGSEGITAKEALEPPNQDHPYAKLTSVHHPSVTVFLPPAGQATGAAVIVAPGGSHQFLAIDIEGYNVAKRLNQIGVAAFVLKYRLAKEKDSPYQVEVHALADARRAIRLVRSRAAEWHVKADRIGIIGFSAGGEVAALAATRYETGQPDAADPIDRVDSRPDFQMLIYPGARADALTFTKQTPPAFLLVADNDAGSAKNVTGLYTALKQAGVSAEVHIYARGGHGFGIRDDAPNPSLALKTWFDRLADWLGDRGLLKPE